MLWATDNGWLITYTISIHMFIQTVLTSIGACGRGTTGELIAWTTHHPRGVGYTILCHICTLHYVGY